jgi:hypothetical protein
MTFGSHAGVMRQHQRRCRNSGRLRPPGVLRRQAHAVLVGGNVASITGENKTSVALSARATLADVKAKNQTRSAIPQASPLIHVMLLAAHCYSPRAQPLMIDMARHSHIGDAPSKDLEGDGEMPARRQRPYRTPPSTQVQQEAKEDRNRTADSIHERYDADAGTSGL